MRQRDKIKARITALLAKTTANGASQAEAVSALEKAHELMKLYLISETDLENPFLSQKCVSQSLPFISIAYKTDLFFFDLMRLFDCKCYWNSKTITFFGFEQDVQLSTYFYELILKSCLNETAQYKRSSDYRKLKTKYHGRTLIASFIKGYLITISKNMNELYSQRETEFNAHTKHALVVVEKKEKVETAFKDLNLNLRTQSIQYMTYQKLAFEKGLLKGEDFKLTQGISDAKKNNTLALN